MQNITPKVNRDLPPGKNQIVGIRQARLLLLTAGFGGQFLGQERPEWRLQRS